MLGTYISYYKSVIKVDAMNQVHRASVLFLTCYCVVGLIHTTFIIFFCVTQDVELTVTTDKNLQRNSVIIAIALQLVAYILETLVFVLVYRKSKTAYNTMIQFHDYLIQYRLTPRSRILRKHLPKMATVYEEGSDMDQSSIMMS